MSYFPFNDINFCWLSQNFFGCELNKQHEGRGN